MEYTYAPGQAIEAGTYIVKLVRVGANVGPGNGNSLGAPGAEALMPPAINAPPQNIPRVEEEVVIGEEDGENGVNAVAALSVTEGETNNSNSNAEGNMGGGKRKTKMNKKGKSKGMKKAKGTRKLSGYMKFAQQVRPQILKNNPNLKSDIIGVGRKIGEMWRGLSPAEKARY